MRDVIRNQGPELLPAIVGKLAEDNDDVFDDVVYCGEDVWAALDGHANDNKQCEDEPRDETNN